MSQTAHLVTDTNPRQGDKPLVVVQVKGNVAIVEPAVENLLAPRLVTGHRSFEEVDPHGILGHLESNRLAELTRVKSPDQWDPCEECSGSAKSSSPQEHCVLCKGAGYVVTFTH